MSLRRGPDTAQSIAKRRSTQAERSIFLHIKVGPYYEVTMSLRPIVLLLLACRLVGADPARVLFIGNSYTGTNALPKVFTEMTRSAGRKVPEVKSSTPGGRTLENHLTIKGSMDLIDAGGWDVVVLQGHSQEAALSETDPAKRKAFLGSAHALCERVRAKSPQARIILYMTWARHADLWKDPKGRELADKLGKDPTDMQARIRKWYETAADAERCELAPVGLAWEANYRSASPLRLHTPDQSHPVFAGTYLASLVIFGRIYGPVKEPITWTGEGKAKVDDGDAVRLRRFAETALAR